MLLDACWWEAEYFDGVVYSETHGAAYGKIDRPELRYFRIRDKGDIIVQLEAEAGRTGWNLFYRRRTVRSADTTKTMYVLGWVPQGPLLAVDPTDTKIYTAETFVPGHPIFYPPVQAAHLGERWTIPKPARIINLAAETT